MPLSEHVICNRVSKRGILRVRESKRACHSGDMREAGRQRTGKKSKKQERQEKEERKEETREE